MDIKKEKKFDEQKYKNEFNKNRYKQFHVALLPYEKEELDQLLKDNNLSGADFVKNAMKDLKAKKKR